MRLAAAMLWLAAAGAAEAGYRLVPTGPMLTPRHAHAMTPLPDGRLLVTGGYLQDGLVPLRATEFYDAAAGAFVAGPPMNVARAEHAALLLGDGRVLVAGGSCASFALPTASAETLDPASGWRRIADMAIARGAYPYLTLGPDGAAWVFAGTWEGRFGEATDLVERLPPGSRAWVAAGRLELPCALSAWVRLAEDRVLRLPGGTHRCCGSALNAACSQWGELRSLQTTGGILARAPGPEGAGTSHAVAREGWVVVVGAKCWLLDHRSAAERRGAPAAPPRLLAVLPEAAGAENAFACWWTPDEIVVVYRDLVILHPISGAAPDHVPLPMRAQTRAAIVSPDAVLLCGGRSESPEPEHVGFVGSMLLLRDGAPVPGR